MAPVPSFGVRVIAMEQLSEFARLSSCRAQVPDNQTGSREPGQNVFEKPWQTMWSFTRVSLPWLIPTKPFGWLLGSVAFLLSWSVGHGKRKSKCKTDTNKPKNKIGMCRCAGKKRCRQPRVRCRLRANQVDAI